MNPKPIVIDGKPYQSVDEMPLDVRQKYEAMMSKLRDANGNRWVTVMLVLLGVALLFCTRLAQLEFGPSSQGRFPYFHNSVVA